MHQMATLQKECREMQAREKEAQMQAQARKEQLEMAVREAQGLRG